MAAREGQAGVTLIEVLVALLVLAIGLLGASMLQLNALKHTDSALRSSQAGFIAHDLLERVRANPGANYALASLSQAPSSGNFGNPRDQDLFDFAEQLRRMLGDDVEASIKVAGAHVMVNLDWNDARAEGGGRQQRQTLTVSSLIGPTQSARP